MTDTSFKRNSQHQTSSVIKKAQPPALPVSLYVDVTLDLLCCYALVPAAKSLMYVILNKELLILITKFLSF